MSAASINTWLVPLLADAISEMRGVSMSRQELRLTSDRVKVVIPPQDELERIRQRMPIYATLVVACNPIPIPIPPRWRGYVQEPVPRTQLDRYASFLAEAISESTGTRLTRQEVNLIGQNGKVALPSQDELEIAMKIGTSLFSILQISATPINIP